MIESGRTVAGLRFRHQLPTDQMHLCAIHPAGNRRSWPEFPKTESGQAAALRWLTEADRKGYGIYFNAMSEAARQGTCEGEEAEVSTVRFCTSCRSARWHSARCVEPHAPTAARSKRLRSCRR